MLSHVGWFFSPGIASCLCTLFLVCCFLICCWDTIRRCAACSQGVGHGMLRSRSHCPSSRSYMVCRLRPCCTPVSHLGCGWSGYHSALFGRSANCCFIVCVSVWACPGMFRPGMHPFEHLYGRVVGPVMREATIIDHAKYPFRPEPACWPVLCGCHGGQLVKVLYYGCLPGMGDGGVFAHAQ